MGAQCCREDIERNAILSRVYQKEQYEESTWPENDDFIQNQVKELNNQKSIFIKQQYKLLKHIEKGHYYFGQLNEKFPDGRGLLYKPGNFLYKGTFLKGLIEGNGQINLINMQCSYKGMFHQGKAAGQGLFYNKNEHYSFEGTWQKSVPTKGVIKFDQNDTKIQFTNFSEKLAVITYQDGKIYTGKVHPSSFMPHGYGNVVFVNKSVYRGEWNQGLMDGKGQFQWRKQDFPNQLIQRYDGQYKDGKKNGFGSFYFQSGKVYQGCWENGKMHGKGKLKLANNEIFQQGLWQKGVFISSFIDVPIGTTQKEMEALLQRVKLNSKN